MSAYLQELYSPGYNTEVGKPKYKVGDMSIFRDINGRMLIRQKGHELKEPIYLSGLLCVTLKRASLEY